MNHLGKRRGAGDGQRIGPWIGLRLPAEPWQQNRLTLVVAVFVVFAGFNFVLPFLPLYVRQLGVKDSRYVALWSGTLIGATPLFAAMMAPVWGGLADRFGYKLMLERALGCFIVILILMAFVGNVRQLLILRIALGLTGGFWVVALALATNVCPPDKMGETVGVMQSGKQFSIALGPLLGGVLADSVGLRPTFVISATLFLFCLGIVVWALKEEKRLVAAPAADQPSAGGHSLGRTLKIPVFLPLLVVLFATRFIDNTFSPVIPLYVERLGPHVRSVASTAGTVLSFAAGASAVSAGLVGRWTRSHSPVTLLLGILASSAVICVSIAAVATVWQLLGLQTLLGFLSGGSLTLIYAIGGLIMPQEIRGAALGVLTSAGMIGRAVSPVVSGAIAAVALPGVFIMDGVLYGLLVLWVVITIRRHWHPTMAH